MFSNKQIDQSLTKRASLIKYAIFTVTETFARFISLQRLRENDGECVNCKIPFLLKSVQDKLFDTGLCPTDEQQRVVI